MGSTPPFHSKSQPITIRFWMALRALPCRRRSWLMSFLFLMLVFSSLLLLTPPLVSLYHALKKKGVDYHLEIYTRLAGLFGFCWLFALEYARNPHLFVRFGLLGLFIIWNVLIWPKIIGRLANSRKQHQIVIYFSGSLLPLTILWISRGFFSWNYLDRFTVEKGNSKNLKILKKHLKDFMSSMRRV